MRSYPPNSSLAAARIVALALVSDGQLGRAELDALEQMRAHERLGLTREAMRGVVHDLCADLLAEAERRGQAVCRIEPALIERLLAEVDEPRLWRTVLALCVGVVHADHVVHDGESTVMLAAIEHWGLEPDALAALAEMDGAAWKR